MIKEIERSSSCESRSSFKTLKSKAIKGSNKDFLGGTCKSKSKGNKAKIKGIRNDHIKSYNINAYKSKSKEKIIENRLISDTISINSNSSNNLNTLCSSIGKRCTPSLENRLSRLLSRANCVAGTVCLIIEKCTREFVAPVISNTDTPPRCHNTKLGGTPTSPDLGLTNNHSSPV